jgi:hypothetical protein
MPPDATLLAEPALLDESACGEGPDRLMVVSKRVQTHLVSVAVQEGILEQERHGLPAKSNPPALALGDPDAGPAGPRVLVELEQLAGPDERSLNLDREVGPTNPRTLSPIPQH